MLINVICEVILVWLGLKLEWKFPSTGAAILASCKVVIEYERDDPVSSNLTLLELNRHTN